MKATITSLLLLASLIGKSQHNGLMIGGGAALAASLGYYLLLEPKQPIYVQGMDGKKFNQDYARYVDNLATHKKISTLSLVASSVAFVSGVCIKTIHTSKNSSVKFSANSATLTLNF